MEQLQIAAPCHFGMEAVLKREIYDLGYEISRVEDGRVVFEGDYEALAYANIHLRTPERILLVVAEFEARSWEELFQGNCLGELFAKGRQILGDQGDFG